MVRRPPRSDQGNSLGEVVHHVREVHGPGIVLPQEVVGDEAILDEPQSPVAFRRRSAVYTQGVRLNQSSQPEFLYREFAGREACAAAPADALPDGVVVEEVAFENNVLSISVVAPADTEWPQPLRVIQVAESDYPGFVSAKLSLMAQEASLES